MDGTRALVVALLLCVAPIGGVVVADALDEGAGPQGETETTGGSMTVFTAENTSEYLAPAAGEIDRTDGRTATLDVGAAIESDAGALESAYLADRLEQRYEDADTDAEREAVVGDASGELTEYITGLVTAERTAISRYNRGAIGTHELLRTLATVSRSAEVTVETLEWLEATADDLGMDAEARRAATDQVRLVPMTGPVRAELSDAAAGTGDRRVHVETAGDGIVLAALDRRDDTYVREAHDPSAKTESIGDQYGGNPSPALDRFTELYPWAIDSFDAIDATGPEQVRLYRFSATHAHGSLETYLDSGSTNILHERQRIDPEAAPSTVLERTEDELELRVHTTRAGGPLGVSVVDATSGNPVDAAIELNGDRIGSAGDDRLWTVAPRGTTNVTATRGDTTVTIETTLG